jgi:TolB-like protein
VPQRTGPTTLALVLSLAAGACRTGGTPAPATAAAAIPALETRAARAPGDAETALRLGAAYRDAGRMDDAVRVLAAAHERAPRDERATLLLGLTYEDRGEVARARGLYAAAERAGASRRLRGQLRDRLALLERREREAEVRAAIAQEAQLAATPPRPGTVAVFPFLFASGDDTLRPLERALAEFLVTDLSHTDRLEVVERARVQLLLDEIGLAESGRMDPATAARGGRLLGAAHVVQGRLSGSQEALDLEVRVARVGGAAAPGGAMGRRGGVRRLIEMQKELALGIYQRLGVELTPAERERVLRRPTENLQAVLAYGLGLEAADAGDFARAAAHFTRAATLDPAFAAARVQARAAEGAGRADGMSTARVLANARPDELEAVRTLVPLPGGRDPFAEAAGAEGFGAGGTWVELILRRP